MLLGEQPVFALTTLTSFAIIALATGRLITTAVRRSCPAMGPNCLRLAPVFLRLASRRLRLELPRKPNLPVLDSRAFKQSQDHKMPNVSSPLRPQWATIPQAEFRDMYRELDTDLAKLCGSLYSRYTRYADDITISTSRDGLSPHLARYPNARGTGQVVIGDRLVSVIEHHGFRINHRKSRLQSHWTRQTCTGLVVNSDRVSPPRLYIRHLRSLVDHWKKNGWQDAAQVLHSEKNRPLFDNRQKILNHVMGRIGYLKMVRGQDDRVAQRLEQIVESLPENH